MSDFAHLCGWVEPSQRTDEQNEAHAAAMARMPSFQVYGSHGDEPNKVLLTDLWRHPETLQALGFAWPGVHQLTGSCVGAGGGNALFTLAAIEVIRLRQPEKIVVPFWLLPYGKSRQRAGMRGRGEGSLGSTFADAVREDGVVDARDSGLPAFRDDQGLVWGQQAELAWSDGGAIPREWLEKARHRIVRTTAPCRSSADVKAAIQNYYPCTVACGRYANPRNARIVEGVTLGKFDASGGHQTTYLGYYLHPSLGPLFWYENQWGHQYPTDPITGLRTGCWLKASDVDWSCRDEVFAFSQFDGFPAQTFEYVY
jgi:hypothetical protein